MDARFLELELLSKLDHQGSFDTSQRHSVENSLQRTERDLIKFLLLQDFVAGQDIPWQHRENQRTSSGIPGESELERLLHQQKTDLLSAILGGRSVTLIITHAGRVRMAELAQDLRSAKIRESYGILWDGRHCDQDMKIRLLDASDSSPVTVAYLDLNGMKYVNDNFGHNAGDVVIRAYLHAIETGLKDKGDAYRVGGDEVVIAFQGCSIDEAKETIQRISRLLMSESLKYGENSIPKVSIAAGIVVARNVNVKTESLREQAEKKMYMAKESTKNKSPRPSSLAIEGENGIFEFS